MRVAVLDVGTNTTRALISDVADAMRVSELDELVASEHDLLDGIALLAAQSRICSTADPRRANP
jgi:hypothetical protein